MSATDELRTQIDGFIWQVRSLMMTADLPPGRADLIPDLRRERDRLIEEGNVRASKRRIRKLLRRHVLFRV